MRDYLGFAATNQAPIRSFPALLRPLPPDGEIVGNEYVALDPTRNDRRLGSFKINNQLRPDSATGIGGGYVVSNIANPASIRRHSDEASNGR